MEMGNDKKGVFTDYFTKQLTTFFEKQAHEEVVKLTLKLPGIRRFRYTEKDYITDELLKAFQNLFPLGAKIIYIVPNSNDDHFIEVAVLVKQ